ncbi:uncharacterized protein BJ171DRAFT_311204 [Polychytrium aggregatum]|uniref:uncharacterized protein n=1 Tax=Polychytrium aggregatum TaxID=110093 RepID=UPI0022FE21DD|nr:uncharacterized protein BJ171DRAFT_311204 [Polychytrium aggregatum]KAI9207070.1 hypothetical protein BJ171DRAFT_311204 [Polychytrium aggregatum]
MSEPTPESSAAKTPDDEALPEASVSHPLPGIDVSEEEPGPLPDIQNAQDAVPGVEAEAIPDIESTRAAESSAKVQPAQRAETPRPSEPVQDAGPAHGNEPVQAPELALASASVGMLAAKAMEIQFSVEEQILDVKLQLAARSSELAQATEQLALQKADNARIRKEYEEKLKRMKGMMASATKALAEHKQTIATGEALAQEKDTQTQCLQRELESLREENAELKATVDRLEQAVTLEKETAKASQIQLEKDYLVTKQELADLKTEFSSYKNRAHVALQKAISGSSSEARIAELEQDKLDLEVTKTAALSRLSHANVQIQALEEDANAASTRAQFLEAKASKLTDELHSASLHIARLNEKINDLSQQNERFAGEHDAAQATMEADIAATKQGFVQLQEQLEEQLAQKTAEYESLERISETLSSELSALRKQHERQAKQLLDLQSAPNAAAVSVPEPQGGDLSRGSSIVTSPVDYRDPNGHLDDTTSERMNTASSSLLDLLSVSINTPNSSFKNTSKSFKEKELELQLEQMAELLNESETTVKQLTNQEAVLKEELRRLDRFEKRQNLSGEYLKNIVMSFLESEAREPLIPVISNLLHLSSEEVARLKKAVASSQEQPLTSYNFGFF